MLDEDHFELKDRYAKLREESNERYLNGVLSFFKWTTTFAFAVLIWIGTNSQNQYYNSYWMFLSIIFILISIIIAVITTFLILNSWSEDLKLKFHVHQLIIVYEVHAKCPCEESKNELERQRKLVVESSLQMFKLKRFDKFLVHHIFVLFIGVIFYLCAIFL